MKPRRLQSATISSSPVSLRSLSACLAIRAGHTSGRSAASDGSAGPGNSGLLGSYPRPEWGLAPKVLDLNGRYDHMEQMMNPLLRSTLRAGRHLAIWVVWQSTGTSLISRRH